MSKTDPKWLDLQYNNRARIPDHAALFERWREASALARQGSPQARLDIAYGDNADERLDVFPAAQSGAPILVFIHGGYWRSLSKDDHSFAAPALVQAGATVVVPEYSLCPTVSIEQIALQMARALAWVYQHAADWGSDPKRIVVAGHSAGGHLAAMLLCCRWREVAADLPPQLVHGALSISGLFDLEPLRLTPFLKEDLRLTPASVKRLSPAFFPRPKRPLMAVVGAEESDEFLRQNLLIRHQWGPSAVPICETVPYCHHLNIVNGLADPASRVHHLALRLLGLV
ncbi:MAG: esterase [Ideonella sp. MAG2]|nr:MAG: esterase [Ideonella sp. MAG2]